MVISDRSFFVSYCQESVKLGFGILFGASGWLAFILLGGCFETFVGFVFAFVGCGVGELGDGGNGRICTNGLRR